MLKQMRIHEAIIYIISYIYTYQFKTQEGLPWINNLYKNVLGNIATLDMKSQLWVQFFYTFPLVQHFIQSKCTGDCSQHLEITAFISCKWPHSSCKIGASIPSEDVHPAGWTWVRMGNDELHSYTEEFFFPIRCSDRLWDGVWSDITTE